MQGQQQQRVEQRYLVARVVHVGAERAVAAAEHENAVQLLVLAGRGHDSLENPGEALEVVMPFVQRRARDFVPANHTSWCVSCCTLSAC